MDVFPIWVVVITHFGQDGDLRVFIFLRMTDKENGYNQLEVLRHELEILNSESPSKEHEYIFDQFIEWQRGSIRKTNKDV